MANLYIENKGDLNLSVKYIAVGLEKKKEDHYS